MSSEVDTINIFLIVVIVIPFVLACLYLVFFCYSHFQYYPGNRLVNHQEPRFENNDKNNNTPV